MQGPICFKPCKPKPELFWINLEQFCSVTSSKHPTHFYELSETEEVVEDETFLEHRTFFELMLISLLQMLLSENLVHGTYALAYHEDLGHSSSW